MARRQPRLTKRERKAQADLQQESGDRMREFAARHGVSGDQLLVGGVPGMPKMSDVIAEAPVVGGDRDHQSEDTTTTLSRAKGPIELDDDAPTVR